MSTLNDGAGFGGVRWRRFAAILIPGLMAAGGLVAMAGQGAIASSFAVSGSSFKVSVGSLDGTGFEQFGGFDTTKDGEGHPVQVSRIRSATIRDLCQSVLVSTPAGKVTVVLRAGQGDKPVEASNLVMDVESLAADAEFTDIQIGRDASTLDQVPGAKGAAGGFAQQAGRIRLTNVKQTAWATTAGTFKLNGLRMSVRPGTHECF
ncbi:MULTISPECIES: DUF6230 family protein [unclassified Spirillospora]|uniref:DUF6230 family protein n=1 Tax=unclassified Spirillospora TaxID=2642701 RepID=UPI0037166EA7